MKRLRVSISSMLNQVLCNPGRWISLYLKSWYQTICKGKWVLRKSCFRATLKICLFFFPFIFISWRLITLQYCSGFCHTLTWISHGFTCIPHPDSPSHQPLHPNPQGLPSAPGPSTCLMHPAWAEKSVIYTHLECESNSHTSFTKV